MTTYAFAGPLTPGKSEELRRLSAELTGPRRAEHDEYMRRYHLTRQYVWIQPTPSMGDLFIVHFEGTTDFLEENLKFTASTHPFDAWYRQTAGPILGWDLSQPLPRDFVEVVLETQEMEMMGRGQPLAAVAPVLPGKTMAVKELAAEVRGPKMDDFADYHRRHGVSREIWYLQHTPEGDMWAYYTEADYPDRLFAELAKSQHPFDLWLNGKLLEITGIDYTKGVAPIPELVLRAELPMGETGRMVA